MCAKSKAKKQLKGAKTRAKKLQEGGHVVPSELTRQISLLTAQVNKEKTRHIATGVNQVHLIRPWAGG
jgi:hypothetical protein